MKDKTNKIIIGIALGFILIFIANVFYNKNSYGLSKSASLDYDMVMNDVVMSSPGIMPMMEMQEKRAYAEDMEMGLSADWDDGGMMMNQSVGYNADRKLEKSVSLNLVIEDKDTFIEKTKELVDFYKGYLQNMYDNNSKHYPSVSMNLKIPTDQLDHFLKDIKENIDYLESENFFVNDVTLEHADLQARLKNAKEEEAQYAEILERAYDIEDILSVTSYRNAVRERIEVMEAQMETMTNRTSYAVVNVEARVLTNGEVITNEWSLKQTWKEAVNDLIRNTKYFVEDAVYFFVTNVLAMTFWLIIALIAYIIYRKKFRK